MLTDAIDVMRYVKASAGRSSLNVVFEADNHPRHDGKTIYLPRITAGTSREKMLEMMSSTDHEVAHDLYSDFGILQEKGIDPTTSPLGFIWNLVEDSRVNVLEATEYEGFRELWEQTTPNLLESIKGNTTGKGLDQIVSSLIKWESGVSRSIFPVCALTGSTFKTDEKLDKILSKFCDRLLECHKIEEKKPGSKATYELARDIFKALGGDPDKEEQKAKEAKEGKGKPVKGEGKKSEEKEPGTETIDVDSDEEGSPSVEDEDWCIKKVKLDDIESKMVTVHDIERAHMSKVGLLHESDPSHMGEWTMTPPENFIVVDYVNNRSSDSTYSCLLTDTSSSEWFKENFNSRVRGKAITSENFAQQVRRLIQIRSRVKYEYGVKRGKLDFPRLSRIVLKQPGISERVFKNKITNTVLDASVTILMDMSGSMSGDKVLFSTEATMLLNSVFQVLQVPLEILGFTDKGERPLCFVFKPFSRARLVSEDLLEHIGRSTGSMSGNPDGDCIIWAYDRLLRRTEKRRLLLVMSDGQPAASRTTSGCAYFTRKAIQEIEQQRKVDIYGLGLCDISVKEYYKAHSTVNDPSEIPHKLLELIERKLLNV